MREAFSRPVTRRHFLAAAAATAFTAPSFSRLASSSLARSRFLHLVDFSSEKGRLHTYALSANRCEILGSTAIESFAASASHPTLPILYVARDCSHWEHLPRGVIETYAVECSSYPLRTVAQTPMSLSATGPRSLAVSNCGRYLLASASTGGAWNAFALNAEGIPASVAVARKETGTFSKSQIVSLPMPHAVAFSSREPLAIGTDPGCGRISLLRPGHDEIAILSRCDAPAGLARSAPVWTRDGKHIVAINEETPSLSIYRIDLALERGTKDAVQLLSTIQTETPVTSLLSHPAEAGIFTSRPQQQGSRIELWKVCNRRLQIENGTWIPHNVLSIVEHGGSLSVISEERLIHMRMKDLCVLDASALPLRGSQAVLTPSYRSKLV